MTPLALLRRPPGFRSSERFLLRTRRVAIIAISVLAIAPAAHAQKPKEAWEYLKEPAFTSAYMKALGPKARTPWLAKRDGPAPEDKFVDVAGQRYVMNAFCKNHDCPDNSAV